MNRKSRAALFFAINSAVAFLISVAGIALLARFFPTYFRRCSASCGRFWCSNYWRAQRECWPSAAIECGERKGSEQSHFCVITDALISREAPRGPDTFA